LKYSDFKKMCAEALLDFGMHSDRAVELLAMICAHESLGGKFRRQVGGGPALGIFQIEPTTHNSIWDNSDSIKSRAIRLGIKEDVNRLETDDRYSIFVARHYLAMDTNPLPKGLEKMADYCKSYWNRTGKATPEKYLNDYLRWRDDDNASAR
jgi:hypothetical protein